MLSRMATNQAAVCPLPPPTPVTSAQPGGGFCLRLELAWGRWRRAWLRRFRPAYVALMQSKRQGTVPAGKQDILDPRDLKYFRNVCDCWFRDEQDLCWRSQGGLARYGIAEVICFSLL